MVLIVNDCSHASEVFEIPGMINLLARGRNRDGLFQDRTEGRIARIDGVLEIAGRGKPSGQIPRLYVS